MLVKLSQQVQKLAEERAELYDIRDRFDDIAATQEMLVELEQQVRHFTSRFRLIKDRLTSEQIAEIWQRSNRLLLSLEQSQEVFDQESHQVRALRRINSELEQLEQFLTSTWVAYALSISHQQFELLDLVKQFVEHSQALEAIRDKLDRARQRLPRNASELAQFDRDLEQLEVGLQELKGLPVQVKRFLRLAQRREATLADVDDVVLEWCRYGNRAREFKIYL